MHDDTTTTTTERSVLEPQTLSIPLPPRFADDQDGPVVMHDEFRQIMTDVRCSRDALELLIGLLRHGSGDALYLSTGDGLGVLLESVHTRVNLAFDALHTMAGELSIET